MSTNKDITKKLVLARGSSTHTHTLNCDQNITYELIDDETIKFLLRDTGVVLHEEHDRIVLPANKHNYYKTNQWEFNPFDGTSSRVWD